MPRYRVLCHGSDFEIRGYGGPDLTAIGFFATRIVTAGNESEAAEKATWALFNEALVQEFVAVTVSDSSKKPMIKADKIERIPWYQDRFRKYGGYIPYHK